MVVFAMETMYQFSRSIRRGKHYDLIVVGGGPSGCAAAIRAARAGKRVLLVEATGALGGMGTNGLVSNWYSLSDGEQILPRGFFWELLLKLADLGALPPGVDPRDLDWQRKLHTGTGFNPELLKMLLDDLCLSAGVEVRFSTRLVDVEIEGKRISGVVTHDVEGFVFRPCLAAIDATGDAVLAHMSGVPCREAGRDTEHIMPPTLCASLVDIDFTRFNRREYEKILQQAVADNEFTQPDRHVPGIFRTGANTAIQNAGHIFGMNALSAKSLSNGYILGRKFVGEYLNFANRRIPGCENSVLVSTATLMGIRESRCIQGVYELSYEDFVNRRQFDDQIGVYNKAVDIHVYDTSDEQWERYLGEYESQDKMGAGEYYGLPYRMLITNCIDNLWVVGRCASSDVKVNGSVRDQPACYVMGEAAGLAASIALDSDTSADSIDVSDLRKELRDGGSFIPES